MAPDVQSDSTDPGVDAPFVADATDSDTTGPLRLRPELVAIGFNETEADALMAEELSKQRIEATEAELRQRIVDSLSHLSVRFGIQDPKYLIKFPSSVLETKKLVPVRADANEEPQAFRDFNSTGIPYGWVESIAFDVDGRRFCILVPTSPNSEMAGRIDRFLNVAMRLNPARILEPVSSDANLAEKVLLGNEWILTSRKTKKGDQSWVTVKTMDDFLHAHSSARTEELDGRPNQTDATAQPRMFPRIKAELGEGNMSKAELENFLGLGLPQDIPKEIEAARSRIPRQRKTNELFAFDHKLQAMLAAKGDARRKALLEFVPDQLRRQLDSLTTEPTDCDVTFEIALPKQKVDRSNTGDEFASVRIAIELKAQSRTRNGVVRPTTSHAITLGFDGTGTVAVGIVAGNNYRRLLTTQSGAHEILNAALVQIEHQFRKSKHNGEADNVFTARTGLRNAQFRIGLVNKQEGNS